MRFDVVLQQVNRYLTLEVKADIVGELIIAHFLPAIFNDGARFDAGHGGRFRFNFKAVGFVYRALQHVALFKFYDRAISFYTARSDILNPPITQKRDVDLAVRFTPTLGENLYSHVVLDN